MIFVRTILAVFASITGVILILPVLVIGLPFRLVAFFVRRISSCFEPNFVPWQQLMEFESTVGWKPKANLDTYYLAPEDDIYHIRTDSFGWPGKSSISESNVVVFGDSFAFGHGIDTDKSFANLNSRLRIKAIGANGYNMVQELILMKKISQQLMDKMVVWFVYLENDLYDNLMPYMSNYRSPFVKNVKGDHDWEIELSHLKPDKWNYSSPRCTNLSILAKLCTPCAISRRVYSACSYLIREGNDVCSQVGAQLVVMTIPNVNQLSQDGIEFLKSQKVEMDKNLFDPDYPDKVIGEICQKQGVSFLASKKHLNSGDYKEFERFHWNEKGHHKIAKIIYNLYKSYVAGGLKPSQIVHFS